MKNFRTLFGLAVGMVLFTSAAMAQNDGIKGNGLPQSKLLFNLEVIAYDGNNCPTGEQDSGHRIAVKADVNPDNLGSNPGGTLLKDLIRDNDILLAPGDFQVLDSNACTDGVAAFQLPLNPCVVEGTVDDPCSVDDPQFQEYLVYARLVGKPGTGVGVTTCATAPGADLTLGTDDDVIVCSTENWISIRQSGKNNVPGGAAPKFEDVSKQLLSICLDTDASGTCDTRLALFNSSLEDYFWNWNTKGKAHAQLFFVAIPD